MVKSEFQFRTPQLLNFSFMINSNYEKATEKKELEHKITVNISNRTDTTALVTIGAEIGSDKRSPYVIRAIMGSEFIWSADLTAENVNELLNHNAPALLLGYLRPIVANITANSPFKVHNIPFMNFTEDERVEHEKSKDEK